MAIRINVEPKSDTRVRLAAKLADRFASTLIGISACMLPAFPAEGDFLVTAGFVEQELTDITEALKRTETAFRTAAGAKCSAGLGLIRAPGGAVYCAQYLGD
jgi:hypothetical protein